jgi:deoxyribose-phosphate aldolase
LDLAWLEIVCKWRSAKTLLEQINQIRAIPHIDHADMSHASLESKIKDAIDHFGGLEPPVVDEEGPLKSELAAIIDHTLLKPTATSTEIRTLCQEAIEHNFKTVCVNSSWITLCIEILSDHQTIPIAVVGFPLGACSTASKAYEALWAIKAGAKEIDMVINIGRLKERQYVYVYLDIHEVYEACGKIPLKVILETSALTKEEIIAACVICKEIGVAFVKTCTGLYGQGGASVPDVALMKAVVGDNIQVKASGGIRTYEDAKRLYNAGARRIGASASVAIVSQSA